MFYVFITFNEKNEFGKIGVTIDMHRRIQLINLQKKKPCKIVYYEEFEDSKKATLRESTLNSLSKKLIYELVYENNPMIADLLKK